MPENEPLKVKIFILSIFEGFLEKVSESRPTLNLDFMWGLFSETFSKNPFEVHYVNN